MLSIMPPPKFKAFDSNGKPLAGGKVYTYIPGTSTPKTTYADPNGVSANPNPIILDSNGEAVIWLQGFYKIVLTDSNNVQQWSVDQISSSPSVATPGAEWLPVNAAFTFVSATQFSVTGDLTGTFQPGRRLQAQVSAGTVYGTVTAASLSGGVTTVTVACDSLNLDSGLSAASVGILAAANPSVPLPANNPGSAMPWVDARAYANLQAAVAAVGSGQRTLVISAAQTVTANITIPANVTLKFMQGGSLNIATGVTVTINGGVEAGLYQIFALNGTGAVTLGLVKEVYPQWFGAKGDGTTDDTAAIQNALNSGALRISLKEATYYFTALTVPAGVIIRGNGQTATVLKTATTGNAVTLNGHNITFKDWTLQQSASVQGNGVVATDKYWFSTENFHVTGFVNNFYMAKAIYHTHKRLLSDYTANGINYYGAAGVWNTDWYNNILTFDTCRFGTNFTATGLSVKGTEVVLINPDFSDSGNASTIGAKIYGDQASYPAHGIKIISPYVELTQTPFWFQYARVEIDGGFVQGGASGSPYTSILTADNSTIFWRGKMKDQDYWANGCVLTNNTTVVFDTGFTGSVRNSGDSVDSTSKVLINSYDEGTFTGTLTGFTSNPTLTVSYVRLGKMVTLFIPSATGTSNATSMQMTGLPANLTPVTNQFWTARVVDNGTNYLGNATASSNNTISFYKDVSLNGFTASSTKGVGAMAITYTLY